MLLRTRFYIPPLRDSTVVRQRLLDVLSATSGGSLIVASAPAGYGKTTLISQWLHFNPHQFAWLTLGAEHSAMDVFWRYTITSVQQVQPQVGAHALKLLEPNANQPDDSLVSDSLYHECVVSFLNDLDELAAMNRAEGALTLVLDDFHFIRNARVYRWLNVFLDHLPASIRVIVTCRDLPELNLPRRRASGQLLQLNAVDMRFSETEALDFFQRVAHWQGDDQVPLSFCKKAEGWVAGLQLVALSLRQARSDAIRLLEDSHLDRHIADYLFEEVFSVQSEELQKFLLLSALPKRFCAALSNELTGKKECFKLIAELEQSNLFLVPLDNHRAWFRYHDLFRQFLLQRVKMQTEFQLKTTLNVAIGWLEANGYYDDAVEVCLEFHLWKEAGHLLSSEFLLQDNNERSQKRHFWLQQLPPEFRVKIKSASTEVEAPSPREIETGEAAIEPLTRRERMVLEQIAKGLSNKEIARELNVSLNTLKVHIRNLYGKMGVENRTQALLKIKP